MANIINTPIDGGIYTDVVPPRYLGSVLKLDIVTSDLDVYSGALPLSVLTEGGISLASSPSAITLEVLSGITFTTGVSPYTFNPYTPILPILSLSDGELFTLCAGILNFCTDEREPQYTAEVMQNNFCGIMFKSADNYSDLLPTPAVSWDMTPNTGVPPYEVKTLTGMASIGFNTGHTLVLTDILKPVPSDTISLSMGDTTSIIKNTINVGLHGTSMGNFSCVVYGASLHDVLGYFDVTAGSYSYSFDTDSPFFYVVVVDKDAENVVVGNDKLVTANDVDHTLKVAEGPSPGGVTAGVKSSLIINHKHKTDNSESFWRTYDKCS